MGLFDNIMSIGQKVSGLVGRGLSFGKKLVGNVDGAFMRMNVNLANGAGGVGGAIFDLVVNLDKR